MAKSIFGLAVFFFVLTSDALAQDGDQFTVRAFHLDLRIQVMKIDALKNYARHLKDNGINTLVMEWEGTYPYEKHPLIPNRFAYSKAEVDSFLKYCKSLGIDVIPLQQCFGHVEYILRHDRYKQLREDQKDYSQVCPLETSLDSALFLDLYTELARTHESPYMHIGGDETYLLGHDEKCRLKSEKDGKSKLYIDYISMICKIVLSLGKRPVLWADIAIQYPDAIRELPKETVFVDWNYGWELNRFGHHEALLKSGYEIWGAPAMRSFPDNYYLSDWKKHFDNIRDFVPLCKKLGYKGIVMTSWSTSGVYSSVFESESKLAELYAIRHVYPLNGFNMLSEAYFKVIKTGTLDIQKFVRAYAAMQFDFNENQSDLLWRCLTTAPYEVKAGLVDSPRRMSIKELADSSQIVVTWLKSLKPNRNQREFDHLLLMARIRQQYLSFELIEQSVNAPEYRVSDSPSVLALLKDLLSVAKTLGDDFTRLQKDFLHPAEVRQENELRNARLISLYQRLSRQR
jgi:hexosaminidase